MYVLGISAYYHDSAAVLLKDGLVVAAIEEERFTRVKHDNAFPAQAIRFCLAKANISVDKLSFIAYYEKPLLKFERVLDTFVKVFPRALPMFLEGMPGWLDSKIKVTQIIRKVTAYKGKIVFVPHHLSHAAATYLSSPFHESAVVTIDGVGEYQTTGIWSAKDQTIVPLKRIDFPHSLGLLYSTFTAFLGFRVNEDEYKLMGLAAYGKPIYLSRIRRLIDIKPDGSFRLNLHYFSFREGSQMWNRYLEKLIGKPREKNEPILQRHRDIAASLQAVTEEVYFSILTYAHNLTGMSNLCLGGGVALNALANGKIYSHSPFRHVHILGAAGDSGAALGCALYVYHKETAKQHRAIPTLFMGSSWTNTQIEAVLEAKKVAYKKLTEQALVSRVSSLLAKGRIVGWFQGRCELGPRALGNRSILCKPNPRDMKRRMNTIKHRESFRPFAGSILQEHAQTYFDVPEKNHASPFMVFCFPVKKAKRMDLAAIVHADNTCRIQTVSKENGLYWSLISSFYRKTGIPCIMNTSFNVMGEPIVESPQQAVDDFLGTNMDALAIGNFLALKEE